MKILFKNYDKTQKELQLFVTGKDDEIAGFEIELAKRKKFTKLGIAIPEDNDKDAYTLKFGEEGQIAKFMFELAKFLHANLTPDNWSTFINSVERACEVDLQVLHPAPRDRNLNALPDDTIRIVNTYLSLSDQSRLNKTNQRLSLVADHIYENLLQEHFPTEYENFQKSLSVGINQHSNDLEEKKSDEKLVDAVVPNYKKAFHDVYKEKYEGLSERDTKLITWFKAGAIDEIKRAKVSLQELLKSLNHPEKTLLHWLPHNRRQAVMDYCYQEVVLPFYTNSSGKIDVKKLGDFKTTLLHWAIFCRQNIETIQNLLEEGANINAITSDGRTPLIWAADNDDFDAVACLSAWPQINPNAIDGEHETALSIAVLRHNTNIFEHLISLFLTNIKISHALRAAIAENDINTFQYLTSLPVFNHNLVLDTTGTNRKLYALHYIAKLGRVEMMQHLATLPRFNVDASMPENTLTAFMLAARHNQIPMMEYLVTQPDNRINAKTNENENAFFLAARYGVIAAAKYLILLPGINTQLINKEGRTALMAAASNHHQDMVRYLGSLPNFINVNAGKTIAPYKGSTAFMMVVRGLRYHTNTDMLKCMASLPGVNINTIANNGDTALKIAIEIAHANRNDALVKYLGSLPGLHVDAKDLMKLFWKDLKEILMYLAAHSQFVLSYIIDKTECRPAVKNAIVEQVNASIARIHRADDPICLLIGFLASLTSRADRSLFRRKKIAFEYYLLANMLLERSKSNQLLEGLNFLIDHLNGHPAFRRFATAEFKDMLQLCKERLIAPPANVEQEIMGSVARIV